MKKLAINKYYNFLMWLEDVFGGLEDKVNNHRVRIDEKYWQKYLSPYSSIPPED